MKFIEQNDLKQLALENSKVCISHEIHADILFFFTFLFLATLWKLFFVHFVASFLATHVGNDMLLGANNHKCKTESPKNFTVSYCYLNHCFPRIITRITLYPLVHIQPKVLIVV